MPVDPDIEFSSETEGEGSPNIAALGLLVGAAAINCFFPGNKDELRTKDL